ncbi:MAG: hypothetical protein ABIP48_11580 [Planctomycetota bacterium]
MDLSFTKPELLEPLLKAESGNGAIVLENLNFDQIESELQVLGQRDLVKIRSRPTLATASGRPTRFVADGGSGMPLKGSGSPTSTATGDMPTEIIVLPVVTDGDRIQLEVAYRASGSGSVTLPKSTKVQMRAGQTVVIGGLKSEPSENKPQQQGASITRLLGIGKPKPKATEFVVLVTPELVPNTKVARPAPTVRESDLVSKSNQPSLGRKNPLASLWGLLAPGKDTETQPDD